MAGIDPKHDPRGALWEARLNLPVLAAAWLAIPTVVLYFSKLEEGWLPVAAVTLAWSIWIVFVVEAAIMLTVVRDRRAWMRGHLLSLVIVVATFPLLTHILEGLLAARALSSMQGVRVLQVLYLAKAAKLLKSLAIMRRTGGPASHPLLLSLASLFAAAVLVGIGDRIVSGKKDPTPFHGAWDVLSALPAWSFALAALAAGGIALRARRRRAGVSEAA